MTSEMILTNARVVTRDGLFAGAVAVRDGRIAAVDARPSSLPGAIDLEGDYLLPGLIELHTDNLEKHFVPRTGVVWPSPLGALMAHDAQIAAAGITTVLDAIRVGQYDDREDRRYIVRESAPVLRHARQAVLLRADHYLHLRCELVDANLVADFDSYADEALVRLVSLMDHTPGQRQWTDVKKFRQFHKGDWTDEEARAVIEERIEMQRLSAGPNRRAILERCGARALPVASHDDTTPEHVAEAVAEGITISEFPTTTVAAAEARQKGMSIVMGAPNVVRGVSHSGNVSALELARDGLLDALSSDYVPASLLHAAFLLHDRIEIPLPDAVAKVSANVADLLKMDDRGEIAVGRRADMIRVRPSEGCPVVRTVWREGQRVS